MENQNVELMLRTPVKKAILKLAIPTVLSTIISLLYNLADSFFVGMLDDHIQLGAVSLAFPVFMIIQAIGNIFGNGAPSYISRCLGAKREEEARRTSAVSVYVSTGVTIAMSALCFLFMEPLLGMLGTSPDTIGPTRDYLQIVVGFSFALTLQAILPALLRAEGRVKQAVTGMIIGTVLNIVLDPIFILVLGQGVKGAAWATIIGNIVASFYYIVIFLKGKTTLSILPQDFRPSGRIFKEVLKIGVPSSASQIIMSFSSVILNNLAAGYGDFVVSAHGVASKMISMVFMVIMGYASGYMPFAGYNYGAGNYKRMLSAFRFTTISATGLCVALLIPFVWLAEPFMRIFSSVPEVIDVGVSFLRAYAWIVPFMALQATIMTTFQAVGDAPRSTIVSIGRQVIYIPFLYLFNYIWNLPGLFYAQTAADLGITVAAVLIGIPLFRRLHQMKDQEGIPEVN